MPFKVGVFLADTSQKWLTSFMFNPTQLQGSGQASPPCCAVCQISLSCVTMLSHNGYYCFLFYFQFKWRLQTDSVPTTLNPIPLIWGLQSEFKLKLSLLLDIYISLVPLQFQLQIVCTVPEHKGQCDPIFISSPIIPSSLKELQVCLPKAELKNV